MEEELRALEEKLLLPEVRGDREAASSLIAEDFREFGSSGRVFTKSDILDLMARESAMDAQLSDFHCTPLAPEAALVTYFATNRKTSAATLRSSLWIRRDERWQMLFHQGTPTSL